MLPSVLIKRLRHRRRRVGRADRTSLTARKSALGADRIDQVICVRKRMRQARGRAQHVGAGAGAGPAARIVVRRSTDVDDLLPGRGVRIIHRHEVAERIRRRHRAQLADRDLQISEVRGHQRAGPHHSHLHQVGVGWGAGVLRDRSAMASSHRDVRELTAWARVFAGRGELERPIDRRGRAVQLHSRTPVRAGRRGRRAHQAHSRALDRGCTRTDFTRHRCADGSGGSRSLLHVDPKPGEDNSEERGGDCRRTNRMRSGPYIGLFCSKGRLQSSTVGTLHLHVPFICPLVTSHNHREHVTSEQPCRPPIPRSRRATATGAARITQNGQLRPACDPGALFCTANTIASPRPQAHEGRRTACRPAGRASRGSTSTGPQFEWTH